MSVSIVVPVYNVKNYLTKCIESILNQTYSDIEIILVDDGSTDGSSEICDAFGEKDSRIHIIHKINGGLSEARNFGINCAKSPWITFVDSDDYVSKDYIEYLLSLVQQSDADIAIGSYTYVTGNKKVDHSTGEIALMDTETTLKRMLLDDGFDMGAWAKLYRTEYLERNLYPVGKLFEDSYTTFQIISEARKIIFGSKSIYYYVNRSDSTVNSEFNIRKFDLIEMTKMNEQFIINNYSNIAPEAHRRVIWSYFSTLNQVLSSKDKCSVHKYTPDLVKYLKKQGRFIKTSSFVPRRDKMAYFILNYFGLTAYKYTWNTYLRFTK